MPEERTSFKQKTLRSFFLAFEKQYKKEDELEDELLTSGMTYIQMRLPVSKITPEFENKLRKDLEGNILKAKIRVATEKDMENIAYLYNKSWMTSSEPYRAITAETIEKIYKYPEVKVLIASVFGSDAGFVILDFEGKQQEFGVIAGLGVLPRFQRKGLGTILGIASWEHFKKKGVKELRCEVYKDNKVSYNFIKSLGFEEFGVKVYKKEDFVVKE